MPEAPAAGCHATLPFGFRSISDEDDWDFAGERSVSPANDFENFTRQAHWEHLTLSELEGYFSARGSIEPNGEAAATV
jgi:hypothetical protein